MNDMVDLPGLPPGVAEALADGTLRDPFARAGSARHRDGAGRARLPARCAGGRGAGARRRRPARTAGAGGAAGLFVGRVDSAEPYLLRITWPGAVQETEDPYSFGPLLGELDLHLFNEGRHFELASHLGANVVTIDGVHRRALRRLGAECARGIGGRRLQHLGPAAPSDAAALSGRRVGAVRPPPRRRARATSSPSSGRTARACR